MNKVIHDYLRHATPGGMQHWSIREAISRVSRSGRSIVDAAGAGVLVEGCTFHFGDYLNCIPTPIYFLVIISVV